MPKLLTYYELREYGIPYSMKHLGRLEALGEFPKRVPIGFYRVAWIKDEVDAQVKKWMAARSTEIGAIGSRARKKRVGRPPRFLNP
jgi:hypothetical protein